MKILMLVNWKVEYCDRRPTGRQAPDYYVKGEPYWFFRYFKEPPQVDVIDISSWRWLEHFEKDKLRFYIWQTLRAIPRLGKYDLVISHGMQSGVVLSLVRRLFRTRAKHIVFDIGSFNSAAEKGFALKLMQFSSKSLDGVIYHTSSQLSYYEKFFPWIAGKSKFIRFGTDLDFFDPENVEKSDDAGKYIVCVGYLKRDWDTLVKAYRKLDTSVRLRLVGHVDERFRGIKGVEQLPLLSLKELIKQIHNACFCVLPLETCNYSYGQMTLLQQMALGKCVITARVPSMVDYVEDNQTAILYEARNADELYSRMKQLLSDRGLNLRIAAAGRQALERACNEKVMAGEIEEVIAAWE